jgi:hypothetical protein
MFDSFVLRLGFMRSKLDHYAYYKQDGDHFLFITLYVDDIMFFGNSKDVICNLKSQFLVQFDMKGLGDTKYILWMEIKRDRLNKRI